MHSDSAPGPNGYTESKYLTELLLEYAAQKLNISTSVVRVGQIAGAANHAGLWNRNEWFPSLVISSLHVGAIPDTLGPRFDRIDWIPVDLLAEILVGLAPKSNHIHESQPLMLHAMNPYRINRKRRASWSSKSFPLVQCSRWRLFLLSPG
jgi:thioester reductase-like protein